MSLINGDQRRCFQFLSQILCKQYQNRIEESCVSHREQSVEAASVSLWHKKIKA